MKKFNLGMSLLVVAVCAWLSLSPVKAYADTVQLTLKTAGPVSGGEQIYPYNFSVNGSTSTIPLMCIDFYNHINFGESWTATIEQIAGNSNYEEAAYIFSTASAPSTTNSPSDQIAVAQWSNWALFETQYTLTANFVSNVVPSNYQGEVTSMLKDAAAHVLAQPNDSLYSQYQMYVPLSGWPSGSDTPQDFIGDAPTPEPGSFILLGTGMLGFAAFWFRRKLAA